MVGRRGDVGGNGRRESGKNPMVGNARRGIRIWCWRRGDVGGKAPPLHEYVKTGREAGKILRCVSLGEGIENVGVEPRGPSKRAQNMFEDCFL